LKATKLGLWKDQLVNTIYGAVFFYYTKAEYQYTLYSKYIAIAKAQYLILI